MLFSDLALHERLQKALTERDFSEATPVQAAVIPKALDGKDLMVSSETGSGKTAAFLLPALNHFQNNPAPRSSTRMLILVPTRELARQVMEETESLAQFTHLTAGLITGGDQFRHQVNTLRKNPEVLIATPGRLLEHMENNNTDFSDLEYLILDEADRMLDFGFSPDMLKIASECRQERQTMLFSATLQQKGMGELISLVLNQPESLTLNTARDKHENIHQQIMLADDQKHKEKLTRWLLENESFDKAIVFSNTRNYADQLCAFLRYSDLKAGVLHGEMDHKERKKMMAMLASGQINILVATDVAARGLDIKGIDLVINFDMARNGDDYVHRIGRTGRAGEKGLAISLIGPNEWNLMSGIERYLKTRFEKRSIKELRGSWKGPKKLKASGKAAGSKKKKVTAKEKAAAGKTRQRVKKNVGKRRKPASEGVTESVDAGFEPMKRKKN
ncbi:DEAD/DEAH box helicase [Endozoicomonas numazuensis]|uniref:RNA helicase n=1 Tax=Endozoicomonas numazuensis TaxID=1137799 RepID=A0A081NM94_9GAMM|nr:DEAD/DEAH box helicase [Endozoicomonas numazuensis]KEQ19567.1 RNA helicase [Endozoicomonas numazuensis]